MIPMIRRRKAPAEQAPALELSSLIDVSFLLLIYFLVTSTLDPKEADLAMTMPSDSSKRVSELIPELMEIELTRDGHIIANDELLDTDATSRDVPMLLDRLSLFAQSAALTGTEPVVAIKSDDDASGQRFIDVLNALASDRVGIERVTIEAFARR